MPLPTVITTALVVDHLTQDLVCITAIYHLDWTTSFFSDVLMLNPLPAFRQEKILINFMRPTTGGGTAFFAPICGTADPARKTNSTRSPI